MTGPSARRPHGLRVLGAALVAVTLAGCGYSFEGNLPGHLRSVAVPVFINRTATAAVENTLTRAVIDAFTASGRLKVADRDTADALLEGEITGFQVQPIAYDARGGIRIYRLLVTLNLRLRDLREGSVLVERTDYQEFADFRVAAAVTETMAREEAVFREAAVTIARAIVDLAVQRF